MEASGQRYRKVGPQQLAEFMRDPKFIQSMSPSQLTDMEQRITTAKWLPNERIVYGAVVEGYTSMDSLPVATGLSEVDVRAAVVGLIGWGAVSSVDIEGY